MTLGVLCPPPITRKNVNLALVRTESYSYLVTVELSFGFVSGIAVVTFAVHVPRKVLQKSGVASADLTVPACGLLLTKPL